MVLNKRLSNAVKEGTSYRIVLGNIVKMAEGFLNKLHPELSREQRICLAQQEPYFTACKEDRKLNDKELALIR